MKKKIALFLLLIISSFFIFNFLNNRTENKLPEVVKNDVKKQREKHPHYLENSPSKEISKRTKEGEKAGRDSNKLTEINKNDIKKQREKHAYYLENSPYKETLKLTKEERKARRIPPNKYYEEQWELTMNPATGKPEPQDILNLQSRLNDKSISKRVPGDEIDNKWEDRGPNNVGGRTRVVLFDPNDSTHKRVFAGAVGGGLWVTENIENKDASWNQVEDVPGNMNISCITVDPRNSNIWYLGTGELYTAGAAVGNGVYKTTNGGKTWTHLPIKKEDGTPAYEEGSNNSGIYYITEIIARDSGILTELYLGVGVNYNIEITTDLYFSQIGYGSEGLYRSVDDGNSWIRFENETFESNSRTDVRMIPNDIEIGPDNTIWMTVKTSIYDFSWGGKIFKSTNGIEWLAVNSSPLPNSNRVELAVSVTNPNKIYALAEGAIYLDDYKGMQGDFPHIYVTEDGFETIKELLKPDDADEGIPAEDFTRGQAFYDLMIEVDPTNDDIVYVGGVDLFRTEKGSNVTSVDDWQQISKWANTSGLDVLNCSYVHADQHAFTFHPTDSNKAVVGCDGGVFYATDLENAESSDIFIERNKGYNVTQFYYGGYGQNLTKELIIAGAQDNGTQFMNGAQSGSNASEEIFGGDGVYSCIDKDGDFMIASYVYNSYFYFKLPYTGEYYIIDQAYEGRFVNPAGLDHNFNILFTTGGSGVNRYVLGEESATKDNLQNENLFGIPSAFKVSPYTTNSTMLLVGTLKGKLLKAINANSPSGEVKWEDISGDEFLGSISDVEFGATENDIFVTFYSYGVKSIWYTSSGGKTWHNKEGDLPNMPVRCILQNPLAKNEVIVGTELGVWKSTNFNKENPNWTRSYNGMKDVKVVDLDLRKGDSKVMATTHGRGVFTGQFTSESSYTFTIAADNSIINACKPNDAVFEFNVNSFGGFNDPINITISGEPEMAIVTIEPSNEVINDHFKVIFGNLENVEVGEYIITITATSTNQSISSDLVLTVLNPNVTVLTPVSPLNGAIEVSTVNSNLTWEEDNFATSYEIEITTDPTFQEVIEIGTTKDNFYKTNNPLNEATTYFWRVRPINECTTGEFSEIFYFQTQVSCQKINYGEIKSVQFEEGLESYMYESKLNLKNNITISDVNVFLHINYQNQRNMDIWLVSPNNTEVKLFDSDCDHVINHMMEIIYDDQALEPIKCGYPVYGDAKPNESLSKFNGENSNGEWILKILIKDPFTSINIYDWGLEICNDKSDSYSTLTKKEITVATESTTAITQNYIKAKSEGSRPSEQIFMLSKLPSLGEIKLQGEPIVFGQTFTQQDINEGLVSYANLSKVSNLDFFDVNIKNATDGFLPNQRINIRIEENFSDSDQDGIANEDDNCLNTPFNVKVDENGCYISEYDDDDDEIKNDSDICNDSVFGNNVNSNGCEKKEINELWGISNGIMYKYNFVSHKTDSIRNFNIGESENYQYPAQKLTSNFDGNLYGSTVFGGETDNGSIFKYNIINNELKVVHSFNENDDGINPNDSGLLRTKNGKLYGQTSSGGFNQGGVLFEYDPQSEKFLKLSNLPEGIRSSGQELIEGTNGILYGTTYDFSTWKLIIFQFDIEKREFTKLVGFGEEDTGTFPTGKLIELNNNLYGVTRKGGKYDKGTIYKYDLINKEFSNLVDFGGEIIGDGPIEGLLKVNDNTFYGLTHNGGSINTGTLYKYDLVNNIVETKFQIVDVFPKDGWFQFGGYAAGSLMQASNNKIYGLTGRDYFLKNKGIIFEYDILLDKVQIGTEFNEKIPANYDLNQHCELIEIKSEDYDTDWDNILNDVDNCPNLFNYDQSDIDEDGIGDICDDDMDGDSVLNDIDNCPETTNVNQADFDGDGIGDVCDDDTDGDGVMNDKDICPNTPTGKSVNTMGCSQSQIDDDNDGVMNNIDTCPNTPSNEVVDDTGCPIFTLPSNNFSIEVISETCPDKNNGELKIMANETHSYVATINGTSYNFNNNSLTVSNLAPGTYTVCISVTGETFEQCYSIVIAEGKTVSGKASVTSNKASIAIEQGTAPYNVHVNGIRVLNTLASSFTIDVKHGDLLEVKTAKSCEGVFLKAIDLFENITVYPNPSKEIFEITLPISEKEVVIELYTMGSQLISKEMYQVVNGKVQINLENRSTGVYVVKINLDTPVNLTIIKE